MARASSIRNRGEAEGYSAAAGLLEKPGDIALDRRGVPRAFVMLCPDGCGQVLSINLDRRAGKAWRADERRGQLTVYPSVWREEGCGAHFIIWRDRLIWCDRYDPTPWNDEGLVERLLSVLPRAPAPPRHFEEVAEELGEMPWEVLWACQRLQSRGRAEVRDHSYFRLAAGTPAARGMRA